MKNKLFIVLCCLIWVWQICQAQVSGNGSQEECNLSVFQEFLDIPDLAIAKGKLMNDGENLLLFSGIDQGIGLTNITKAGTPNWTKSYKFSENTFPSDLIKATDGSLWAVANASTTSALSYLLKLTTGGDIIWAKELESPGISIEKLIEIGGNSFFAVGSREEPGSSKMGVVMKIDNQGEVEWARDYNIDPNTSEDTGFSNIIAVGPNRWVIGGRTGFSFFTTQTTQLICINDAGDIVWEKSHNAEVKFISAMKLSSANTIQVFYSQGVLNDTNLVLSEFDLDGNTLRSIVVSNDSRLSTSHFVELPNTDLLCFGSRINNPFFFTLDSDWNLLASKEYDAGYGPSFTGNTFLVEGENIFFAAERYENAPRGGFLAKTNLDFELDDCLTSEIDLAINTFNFNELSSELESNSFNVLVEDEDPVLQLVDMTSFDICRIASDSIVTQDSLELCDGDSIIIGGMTYFNNTIVEQVFTTDNGCDSTHRTTLFFFPNVETFQTITIEEGDNAIVFGSLVTQAGVFEETYVASNGCDSTHQITVDVLPSSSGCEEILLTAIGAEGEDMYLDNIVANDGSVWVIFSDGIASWLNWGVAKLSKEGEVLWIKNYQFDGRQRFNVLLPTYDGGLVVLGDLSRQSYMFKLDSDGDFLWGNRIDYLDFAEGYDLIETEDNDILMIGEGFETVTSDRHGLVMKLTEDGEIMWSKRIAYNGPQISFGLRLASIERAFNGNYIVTGQFRFTPVVLEMTGEGEVVWLRRYEINNNIGSPIKLSRNGTGDGYFFSPINFSFFDNSTAFIGEIALNGDLKNLRSFTTPNLKSVTNLQLSPNGNLLVNLSTDADNFGKIVLELDSDLKEVKNRTLGDEGSPSSISLAVDQNYVFQATDAQVDGEQGFLFSRSTRLLNIACGNNSVTFDKEYLTAVDTIPLTTYEIIDQFYDSDYSVEEEDYEGVVELQCSELENEIFTSETQFFCEGTSAIIFGQVVEENGIFSETNAIDLGCDSTHQITAIFQNAQSTSETLTYTEGDTAVIFGVTVTSDGIFDDTSTGSNGCDSTHTITVVFTPDVNPCSAVFTSEQIETCSGDSLLIFGDWIFADGIYSSLEVSSQGCDSTHQITTIFIQPIYEQENLQFCAGDTVVINGQTITSNQIVETEFIGSNGCDSILQSFIEFKTEIETNEVLTFCQGEIANINGIVYSENAIAFNTAMSSQGCDSTHITTLIFQPAALTTDTIVACVGDTVILPNEIIIGLFPLTENLVRNEVGVNGCDSTHLINLTFEESFYSLDTIYFCEGETASIFGNQYFESAFVEEESVNIAGCDSTNAMQIIFTPNIFTEEYIELCQGESVMVFGNEISENQILTEVFPSANGCDSIHQVEVVFANTFESYQNETICAEDFLLFFGDTIQDAGTYTQELTPLGAGCDSMVILTVDIAQEITAELISNLEVESGIPFNLPLLNLNANTSLIWSNAEFLSCSDCSNPVARVAADQEFSVLISNEFGCQKLLRVMVTVREKLDFYIPNVFSPNNDGINDGFTIFTNDQEAIIENLQIYDRWGAMIFETTDVPPNNVDLGWKGRHKGRPLNPAVFVYQATIRLNDGTKVFRAGDVVLLR